MGIATEIDERLRVSQWKLTLFRRYTRRYLAKNFHAVRILGGVDPMLFKGEEPVLVAANHPGWWDPMLAIFLAEEMAPQRQHYAPIEDQMLEKYAIFKRLGFFGVEKNTVAGLKDFLRVGTRAMSESKAVLWMTPQGDLIDARQRPLNLKKGISQLASRIDKVKILTLAVEYVFWNEKKPELLVHFDVCSSSSKDSEFHTYLTQALVQSMEQLAQASIARNPDRFQLLLGGAMGVGGIYGLWQKLRGKKTEHTE